MRNSISITVLLYGRERCRVAKKASRLGRALASPRNAGGRRLHPDLFCRHVGLRRNGSGTAPNSTRLSPSCPLPARAPAAVRAKPIWHSAGFEATGTPIPQVLCEYKDIRSKLDAKQNRKGSTRSPVEQCLNYVRGARRGLFGNEPVQPWWGLVTDMNEFRLYWWDRAPSEYLRFFIRSERSLLRRLRSPDRNGGGALRSLSFLQALLARHAVIGSRDGRCCSGSLNGNGRADEARRRVLRPLQGGPRASLQRT